MKWQVLVEASLTAGLPCGLLVANVLARAVNGKVPVRLLNASEEAAGELHVKALEEEARAEAEGAGLLSVPVQANLQGLTPNPSTKIVTASGETPLLGNSYRTSTGVHRP